nr:MULTISPECIES: IS200/IS605 family element RNA-guided endonuclease TnpB [unclassified Paenibacillus]
MIHHKAFRFRLYPTKAQELLFRKTLGCTRFVFNNFLAHWNESYEATGKGLSYNACATQLPSLKKSLPWLKEVDSIALQSAVRHLADSFDRFFRKQNDAPRFKCKRNPVQSFTTRFTNGNIAVEGNRLQLPKAGMVKFGKSRHVEGRILSASVRLAPSGKWFVVLTCEVDIAPLPAINRDIGIDVGISSLAVSSDGEVIENPKSYVRHERQLAKWQRRLSRRKPGGRNYQKAKRHIARIHERIRNRRQDALHKLTTKWIRENQTICIEDLRIANMLQNRKLAKHIADASWGELRRQLEYKAVWYGRTIKHVPTFSPSSQMCHVCGTVNQEVRDLRIRTWTCCHCHTTHDRDSNASYNIKVMAV